MPLFLFIFVQIIEIIVKLNKLFFQKLNVINLSRCFIFPVGQNMFQVFFICIDQVKHENVIIIILQVEKGIGIISNITFNDWLIKFFILNPT